MLPEETKFLDLDMVVQNIIDAGDQDLFREATQCYQIGSHRAAVILVWCATVDCLKRRIDELATEGDSTAQDAQHELKKLEGQARYEENLIAEAKKCDLIDEYDAKSLRFARDTRSKCAHPSGVIPSAECVRHVLHICSQIALCRRGYRGVAYIEDVVTTQFDDKHFLPLDHKVDEHCNAIIEKVPARLWPQFTILAAQARSDSPPETWRKNAIAFFKVLLAGAESGIANRIAGGMQGFEAESPELFSTLVGLDARVGQFWDEQKRAQARSRLASMGLAKISAEETCAWARLCAEDGFVDEDLDLLRRRFTVLAKHFAREDAFLQARREDLTRLLLDMVKDDGTSTQAAIACRILFPSSLFDEISEHVRGILEEVIRRFVREEKSREVIEGVAEWPEALISEFLRCSESFFLECTEDNADDVMILLDAARELARRAPTRLPPEFSNTINRILEGELQGDWATEDSVIGETLRSQLRLLLDQHGDFLSEIKSDLMVIEADDSPDVAG